jgi:polyphosphate kinase
MGQLQMGQLGRLPFNVNVDTIQNAIIIIFHPLESFNTVKQIVEQLLKRTVGF